MKNNKMGRTCRANETGKRVTILVTKSKAMVITSGPRAACGTYRAILRFSNKLFVIVVHCVRHM
jgi:hypothetical protein